jgi:dTDP-glucose 4,6-dehydratase
VVITRSSNQFGPYQFPEKLIPFFVTTLLEGGKVPLYGDGLNVRDWLFVLDNCTGVQTVLRDGKVGEVYNIGAGNEKTNREITDTILAALGKDESSVEYVEDRKGHDRRYSIATDKSAALGWAPSRTFEQAIDDTIKWYVDHRDWWAPLRERVKNR